MDCHCGSGAGGVPCCFMSMARKPRSPYAAPAADIEQSRKSCHGKQDSMRGEEALSESGTRAGCGVLRSSKAVSRLCGLPVACLCFDSQWTQPWHVSEQVSVRGRCN